MQTLAIELLAPQPPAAGRRPATDEATDSSRDSFGGALARAQQRAGETDEGVVVVTGPVVPRLDAPVAGTDGNQTAGETTGRPSAAPATNTAAGANSPVMLAPAGDTGTSQFASVAPSGSAGTIHAVPDAETVVAAVTPGLAASARRAPLPGTPTQATSPVQVALGNAIGQPATTSGDALPPAGAEGAALQPSPRTAAAAPRPAGKAQASAGASRPNTAGTDTNLAVNGNGMGAAKPDAVMPRSPEATAPAPLVGAAADGTLALAGGASPDDGALAPGIAGERADAATRIGAQLATNRLPPAPPPPPGEQVSVHIQNAVRSGADRIHIRLHPAELGRVEVKLEIGHDRAVTAIVTTEKPEAAELLSRDARILQRALEDAGLRADTGSLSFRHGGDGAGAQRTPATAAHPSGTGPAAMATDDSTAAPPVARIRHDGLVDFDA